MLSKGGKKQPEKGCWNSLGCGGVSDGCLACMVLGLLLDLLLINNF